MMGIHGGSFVILARTEIHGIFGDRLTAKTILQREKLGLQISHGLTQLGQLRFGTVDFQTSEFGNFQGFLQQGTHIIKMGEHTLGIGIAFTAMHLIGIKTESIIEAFGFLAGFVNEPFAQRFECLKLTALNLEVGSDRTTLVLGCHGILLLWLMVFIGWFLQQ
jgi:hypothetical protein